VHAIARRYFVIRDFPTGCSTHTWRRRRGTAVTSMWDQYKLEGLTRATKSAEPARPSAKASDRPTSPAVPANWLAFTSPAPIWTRQNAPAFSAECPSAWIVDQGGLKQNYFWIRSNAPPRQSANGEPWYDFDVTMAYFPDPRNIATPQSELSSVAQRYLRAWAIHDNLQLPEPIEFSEVQTIFGSGLLAEFSYPTEFQYEEAARLVFVLRPRGVFLISANSPLADSSLGEQVHHMFSSLSFQDKTAGENVREFMRGRQSTLQPR
jgi:hypothetical protein